VCNSNINVCNNMINDNIINVIMKMVILILMKIININDNN